MLYIMKDKMYTDMWFVINLNLLLTKHYLYRTDMSKWHCRYYYGLPLLLDKVNKFHLNFLFFYLLKLAVLTQTTVNKKLCLGWTLLNQLFLPEPITSYQVDFVSVVSATGTYLSKYVKFELHLHSYKLLSLYFRL